MPLYRYVKKQHAVVNTPVASKSKKKPPKIISYLLILVGLFVFGNAAYPIIAYQLFVSPKFSQVLISPVSDGEVSQTFGDATIYQQEIQLLDLTSFNNWIEEDQSEMEETNIEQENSYFLSIPKLGIENAVVIIGGKDLKKYLVQYPGTALPGRFGNTVIFGHSVLPQFYNPKNYMTIFATLPTINPKDEIIVNYNQVKYRYRVEKMLEVSPTDVSILAQRFDDSYLTLITCVPPGTYLKRLIIRARLIKV
jgi:sortase A